MNGSLWISLCVLVLLSWGVVGVLQKMAMDRIAAQTAMVWVAAGFMLLASCSFSQDFGPELLLKQLALRRVERCLQRAGNIVPHGGDAPRRQGFDRRIAGSTLPSICRHAGSSFFARKAECIPSSGVGCGVLAGILLSAESSASS